MKLPELINVALLSLCLGGCFLHNYPLGRISAKVSDTEARVDMRNQKLFVGEKVTLLKDDCSKRYTSEARRKGMQCELIKVGEGEIIKVLNDDVSIVKAKPDSHLVEGDWVKSAER